MAPVTSAILPGGRVMGFLVLALLMGRLLIQCPGLTPGVAEIFCQRGVRQLVPVGQLLPGTRQSGKVAYGTPGSGLPQCEGLGQLQTLFLCVAVFDVQSGFQQAAEAGAVEQGQSGACVTCLP